MDTQYNLLKVYYECRYFFNMKQASYLEFKDHCVSDIVIFMHDKYHI